MTVSSPDLEIRRQPVQARARETYDTILNTAADLLDDVGFEKFNTNLLADEAGLKVRTVYRYFPNKYAVVVALTRRLSEKWTQWTEQFYTLLEEDEADMEAALIQSLQSWIAKARAEPGSVTVLQIANATPDLRQVNLEIFDQICDKSAAALARRLPHLSAARLTAVTRTMVGTLHGGVDLSMQLTPEEADAHIREITRMICCYINALEAA